MSMKIAIYSHEKRSLALARKVLERCRNLGVIINGNYFSDKSIFVEALREQRFQVVLLHVTGCCALEHDVLEEIRRLCTDTTLVVIRGDFRSFLGMNSMKYTASFNGQEHILDLQDIYWIESYNRKTSVVAGKKRFRIRARLDEEEQRLPKAHFSRINRYTLVNLLYVQYVEGKLLHMINGEVLEVSANRLKEFKEQYEQYIGRRFVVL